MKSSADAAIRNLYSVLDMDLTWESTYAVALELKRLHPGVPLEGVTLNQLFDWTLELPGFEDDPALCNDDILNSIYQEWYEVILHDGK